MAKRPPPQNLGAQYTFGPRDVRNGQTAQPSGFSYTAPGKSCETAGKVQLTFRGGQPALRFCKQAGKPGLLVPVQSAEQAAQVGAAGLEALRGRSLKQAAAHFPTALGLGRVRRAR